MRKMFKINLIGIIITLVLYITIWGGILSQILLGGLQLICFLTICLYFQMLTQTLKTHLVTYGILTSLTILLTCLYPDTFFLVFFWPFSGVLSLYFLYITYQLKSKGYEEV